MKKRKFTSLENFDDNELLIGFQNLGIRSSKEAASFYSELDLGGDYYPTWGCTIPLAINRDYG